MLIILGTTDEVNTCDCCGRTDLKDTVALEDDQTGAILYYGCVCAAKKQNVPSKQIKSEAKKADDIRRKAAQAEKNRLDEIEDSRYQAFIDNKVAGQRVTPDVFTGRVTGKENRFNQLQFLGGFVKVRKMYEAENNC
jgi:hypothetical protein